MASILQRMVDASERLLFGATAEEAVQRRIALIDRRIDAALTRMLEALDADADEEEQEERARLTPPAQEHEQQEDRDEDDA